ncbi:MAG: PIN domain-containing protein [Betaproteobacteria bacterium]|nr:PIN domain-containing protein [Betaproteobacteria bacterium]
MAASVIVDASFLVTLHSRRETNHGWADRQARRYPPPWHTCEAAISETFYLLGPGDGASVFAALLQRGVVAASFHFAESAEPVLALMAKYADVPMSFADACLVRMTELLPEPILLTTDTDFRIYRRHSRRTVPCILPS